MKDDHLGREQEEDPTASVEADSVPVLEEELPARDAGSGSAGLAPCPSCGRMTMTGGECSVCRDEVEAFREYQAHGEPEALPLFTDSDRAERFVRLVLAISTAWWVAMVVALGAMIPAVRTQEITPVNGALLGFVVVNVAVTAYLRMVLWRRFVRPPVRDGILSRSGLPSWRLYREALEVLGRGRAWVVVPVVMWVALAAVWIVVAVLVD